VEKLGLKRIREILASDAKPKIDALLAKDKALEPEANAIAAVEKLIRFNRDLYTLCVNFVQLQKIFTAAKTPAIFQAGTFVSGPAQLRPVPHRRGCPPSTRQWRAWRARISRILTACARPRAKN